MIPHIHIKILKKMKGILNMGRVLYLSLMMSIQKVIKKEDLNTNSENDLLIKKIGNQNQLNMEVRSRKENHLVTLSKTSNLLKVHYQLTVVKKVTVSKQNIMMLISTLKEHFKMLEMMRETNVTVEALSFVLLNNNEGTKERNKNRSEYIF